jgi:hypothetical protein
MTARVMFRFSLIAVALALCCGIPISATSYPPVTFNELITRADVIFVGEVADVHAYSLDTRDGFLVKTRVTFRVSDPLWGTTSILEVFDFLGGELNGIRMEVAEMPKFAVGDRRVVFARRDRSINPIVGFTQGLLRVDRDINGLDRVFTLDGTPVAGPETIGSLAPAMSMTRPAMRLSDFRGRVATALAEARRK